MPNLMDLIHEDKGARDMFIGYLNLGLTTFQEVRLFRLLRAFSVALEIKTGAEDQLESLRRFCK